MCAARIIRFFSITVVALLANVVGVQNAFAQWTYRAAPEPIVRNISVFLNTPAMGTNTLIASTLTDGMFKGTEIGTSTTWQKIGTGIPIVQMRTHATVSSSIFYAASQGAGVFRTIDGGTSWVAVNGSGATALPCLDVRTIAIPITTPPRTLLAATFCRNNSGVFRGIDDGTNPVVWTRLGPAAGMANSLPSDVQSSALTRIGSGPTTIHFLATANYGIFRSGDDGATWVSANNGISGSSNAFNVSFSGSTVADSNNVLAYMHGSGIYRSTDSGSNWSLANSGLPANFAALGGINRESLQTLYIGLDKAGVYKTIDGGLNWIAWGTTATDGSAAYTRGINNTATGTYYLATLNGIVKTTDSGLTLSGVGNMLGGRINAVTHDRDTPSIAYLALHFPLRINYIYGDYNSNATFTPIESGITGATTDGVVYQDRLAPATLYVVTNNRGIFKSVNGGTSFAPINAGLPNMIGQVSRLAIDHTNSQILYLGLSNAGGVYKSTNGGTSWTPSSSGLSSSLAMSVNHVTVDGNNALFVWAATDAGAYKSVDAGATWTQMYTAVDGAGATLPVSSVRVRLGNTNEVYLTTYHVNSDGTLLPSSGIQKSTTGGTLGSWTNILPGQRGSQVRVTASGDVYAGVSAQIGNPAVYFSASGSNFFTPYSVNLQGSDIRTFGFAADESALISLTLENGFYTNDAAAPPIVPLKQTITEAPNNFLNLVFSPQMFGTTSATKSVTITNAGSTPANIIGFGSDNTTFVVQSHTCGTPLPPAATCVVNVAFAPTPPIQGETAGTLTAIGPVSGFSVKLWGAGFSPASPFARTSLTPGAVPAYAGWTVMGNNFRELAFGNQAVGTSRTLSYTLTNFGGALLNISSITVDNPRYVLGGTCGATLASGASCLVSFTYTPTVVGQDHGNVNITTDSVFTIAGQLNFSLNGVGENPLVDGSLVLGFGDGGRAYISSGPYGTEQGEYVAKQSDGKTLVLSVGRSAIDDGFTVPVLTRLNIDGTLDSSWGTAGYVRLPTPVASGFSGVNEGRLFVLLSGKIIVSIDYNTPSNGNDAIVYRLLASGAIDATFGTAGITTLSDFGARTTLYADGRILVGGLVASSFPALNHLAFVRLTADGVPDPSFGINGRSDIYLLDSVQIGQGFTHLSIAADGKILFSYPFGVGAARDIAIYRLSADGAQDTTWGTAGRVNVAATNREDNVRLTRFQSDGKLLILSRTVQPTSTTLYEVLLTRLNADGSVDTSFGVNGVVETVIGAPLSSNNLAQDMQVLADGKIVVAGHRNGTGFGRDIFVVRYMRDGSLDTSFGNGGVKDIPLTSLNEFVRSLSLDSDGALLVTGYISMIDVDRGNTVGTAYVLKLKNTVGAALVNLTVNKVGAGTVTSDIPGINCGSACVASLAGGTVITLTATPASGSTFTGWSGVVCPGTGTCTITMSAATTVTATFNGGAVSLVNVISRKTHGATGSQSLAIEAGIAISGAVTVEPRTIGAGHSIVFQFSGPVTSVGGASAKDLASVDVGSTAVGFAGNEVIVTLTNVPNNRRATISVNDVNATGLNFFRTMGFLVGDVNNTRTVNPSDTSAVKARSGQATTAQNFQFDVNASGTINASDIATVKARAATGSVLSP